MNVSTFASSKLCEAVYNTLYPNPTTVPYVRLLTHLDVNIWPLANIYYLICWHVVCAKSACDSCPVTRPVMVTAAPGAAPRVKWPECIAVISNLRKYEGTEIIEWWRNLMFVSAATFPWWGWWRVAAPGTSGHTHQHQIPIPGGTWGEATNTRHVIFKPSFKCIVFNMNFIILFRFICY